jgi:rhodanese-related sulfurtransferase
MSWLTRLFHRAPPAWSWVSAQDLQARLAQSPAPRLVDVRGPEEFRGPEGHVPGAENRPLPELLANPASLVQEARPIVLICLSQIRSAQAANALAAAGVGQLSVLRGGMKAWNAAGLPVKR